MRDTPGVIAPPPLIFLLPLAAGVLLTLLVPLRILPHAVARGLVGGLLIAAWLVLSSSAIWVMRRARTSLSPRVPTTSLVVSGPFRFSRNPLYLGLTLLYLGVAVLAQALWALVLLPAVLVTIQRGVIAREERYLERKFGADYRHYKERVRRWL